MNYVIGDIHGYYNCLIKLINKLKNIENIYFVGDLIDRGPDSKKIIDLIKNTNSFHLVLGNHEDLMITYGNSLIIYYESFIENNDLNAFSKWYNSGGVNWYKNGGDKTLVSYGILDIENKKFKISKKNILKFKEDLEWLEKVPLYIIPNLRINNKKILISHSSCINIWENKEKIKKDYFKEYILWNREKIIKKSSIFNIFGHTPVYFGPDLSDSYINIDSGIYIKVLGYNRLTAFCIETKEIIFQDNV